MQREREILIEVSEREERERGIEIIERKKQKKPVLLFLSFCFSFVLTLMSRRSGCERMKGEFGFGWIWRCERGEVKKDERERKKKTSPLRPIDCRRLALVLLLAASCVLAREERDWIVMSAAESA